MEELLDLIASDESHQVSDKIKEILYAKSAEKVDAFRQKPQSTFLTRN